MLKIGLAQVDLAWNEVGKNLKQCERLIEQAQRLEINLLVLPEMFVCGFSLLRGEAARRAGNLGSEFLETQAKSRSMYLCGTIPWFLPNSDRPCNTLRLFGPEGHLGDYHKRYLFSYQGEDKVYEAGKDNLTVSIDDVRLSFFICYDLRFPEAFRTVVDQTDVYIIPANWPSGRQQHWEALLKARAIENQAFVAGVNRVGIGASGKLHYLGGSAIYNPLGERLSYAIESEALLYANVDSGQCQAIRAEFPFLADRLRKVCD